MTCNKFRFLYKMLQFWSCIQWIDQSDACVIFTTGHKLYHWKDKNRWCSAIFHFISLTMQCSTFNPWPDPASGWTNANPHMSWIAQSLCEIVYWVVRGIQGEVWVQKPKTLSKTSMHGSKISDDSQKVISMKIHPANSKNRLRSSRFLYFYFSMNPKGLRNVSQQTNILKPPKNSFLR